MECGEIVARHRNSGNSNLQKKALDEALLSDEVLPLKAIAKSLRCHCKVLRRRFPELCQLIEKRYETSFDAHRMKKVLEDALECDKNGSPSFRGIWPKSH